MCARLHPEPSGGLVGIAKAAAESPLLEAKRRVEYFELPARRYLSRCSNGRMPFQWTLNPYRGCEYGCRYCYARYTHEFMELRDPRDFEEKIFAKRWNAAAFRAEVRRVKRGEAIGMGTATDPYQPAERRYGLTRRMLEVVAGERGLRLSLVTKSDLIVRDIGLFSEIARRNRIDLNLTITTTDEELARLLEPQAPRPGLRLEAVAKLSGAGLSVGVLPNPIMPFLTDDEQSLDALAAAAARAGAKWFGGGILFLKPCAKQVFFPLLERHFPQLVARYRSRYGARAFQRGVYADTVAECIGRIRVRHGLERAAPEYKPELWEPDPQLELFVPLDLPLE